MPQFVVFIAPLARYLLEPKRIPNGLSLSLSGLTVFQKKLNVMDVVLRNGSVSAKLFVLDILLVIEMLDKCDQLYDV